MHRESGIDDMLEAKLELPRAQVDVLLRSSPINPSALEARTDLFSSDYEFWDPQQAVNLRAAQVNRGGKVLNLGVADAPNGNAFVFIALHGT